MADGETNSYYPNVYRFGDLLDRFVKGEIPEKNFRLLLPMRQHMISFIGHLKETCNKLRHELSHARPSGKSKPVGARPPGAEMAMGSVHDERVKLLAGWLDRASTACFTVGVLVPMAG